MPSTPPGARALTDLARGQSEWRPWLAVLDATRQATREGAWRSVVPAAPSPDQNAPLLAGITVTVETRLLHRWFQALFATAAAGGGPAVTLAAAVRADTDRLAALLEAGLVEDTGRVAATAAVLAVDAGALGAVASVAPLPLLRACAEQWAERVTPAWQHGYCPVCGAWPTLAEARGLERARRLRCLRCAADWATLWLRCPFCGNDDHGRLGSLVLATENDGEMRRALVATSVDTCTSCRGYLKTVTTLAPTAADDLGLIDLATVELDAAALAHGYARPPGPGVALGTRVLPQAHGRGRHWWRA